MDALRDTLYLIALFFSLSLSGAWLLKRFKIETDPVFYPFAGWALYITLAVGLGVTSVFGVLAGAFLFFSLAFYGIFRLLSKKRQFTDIASRPFFAALILILPLLFAVAQLQPHEWDDFSHWLPNSFFLYSHGTFPAPGQLLSSTWPAYPYGFTLLIATLGWMRGDFVLAGGPLIATGLLFLVACVILRHLNGMPQTRKEFFKFLKNISLLGLVLIFINPGFSEYITLSSCSDFVTAVVFAMLAYTGWQALQPEFKRDMLAMFSLLSIVFVQLRQANTFLLAILVVSLLIAHWPLIRQRAAYFVLAVLPCYFVWLLWGAHGLAFNKGMGFLPSGEFRADLALPLFEGMLDVMRVKWGYFALLLFTVGRGFMMFRSPTSLNRFYLALGLCVLGYFGFLVVAYLGSSFVEVEIRTAASFFRYMGHLNLAVFMAVLFLVVPYAQTKLAGYRKPVAVLQFTGLAGILIFGVAANFMHLLPGPHKLAAPVQEFARSIAPKIPADAKMVAILPAFEGLEVSIFNFALDQAMVPPTTRLRSRYTVFDHRYQPTRLEGLLNDYDTVLVGPQDELGWQQLGLSAQNHWALFHRQSNKEGDKWVMITP